MVIEHGVRFYCGTPLVGSNGHRLGTLCFVDSKPRKMEAHNCLILSNLCARAVPRPDVPAAIHKAALMMWTHSLLVVCAPTAASSYFPLQVEGVRVRA